MSGKSVSKFEWQRAVASEHGPPSPTTRLVLLTLSIFMDGNCKDCFPSTKKISIATGLSERSVCTHLEIAKADGWITKIKKSGDGQGWKRHSYNASIPEKALKDVQHLNEKGTETDSAPYAKGTEPPSKGTEPPSKKALKEVQSTIPITIPNTITPDASVIFAFFVSEIQPARKSKTRAVKNIKKYLNRGIPPETLKSAILNYKSTLNGTDPKYRKDPANFFGINEPYAEDFYPEKFEPSQSINEDHQKEFDFENQFHEE